MELEHEVEKIEIGFIKAKKQFTALDIGNELKKRGINVRQRQVSPIVRQHFSECDIYEDAKYTREIIPVKNGSCQAYLYFNIDQDTSEYTDRDQEPLPWDPNKQTDDDISVIVQQVVYVGSRNSKIFHSPNCMYAVRIKQENTISFEDMVDASAKHYRKCKRE